MQNQIIFPKVSLACASFSLLLLVACRENPKPPTTISTIPVAAALPPLIRPLRADLDPVFLSKTFDATQAISWQQNDGSLIKIAKNSLCRADKTPFSGKVRLRYRAFHDGISIALAGIPMAHNGGNLTTAGSFELRADDAKTGESLDFLPQKSAYVHMRARGETAGEFPFWYLNPETRRWDSLGKSDLERQNSQRIVKTYEKVAAPPTKETLFAFNYLAILDVYTNDNWKILNSATATDSLSNLLKPKLEKYELGYEKAYISSRHVVKWDGNEYPAALFVWKKLDANNYPDWLKDAALMLKNISENRYSITAKQESTNAQFYAEVEAVMPLKALFTVAPEIWKTNRNIALQAAKSLILVENQRIERVSALYRSFSVEKFGVYNWDKILKDQQSVVVEATVKFQTPFNEQLTRPDLLLLTGDAKSVVTLPQNIWATLPLRPDPKARIFAILPNQKIAFYSASRYQNIQFDQLRNLQNPVLLLDMEEKIVKSETELRRLLML